VNIPHYTAGQLLAAPFELSNYSAKKVWIPLVVVGSVGALAVIGTRASANATPLDTQKLLFGIPMIAAATLLVGAGEEAEMRGFYYPAFSELTGSVYTGAVLQALLFGYMHTDWFLRGFPMVSGGVLAEINRTKPAQYQGANMVKFIATATSGLLDAWIVSSEDNGLLKAVAAHAMWDFLLLTSGLLANNEAPPIVFSMNF
jgi:membrane protease YdiL (CAAX protease family)